MAVSTKSYIFSNWYVTDNLVIDQMVPIASGQYRLNTQFTGHYSDDMDWDGAGRTYIDPGDTVGVRKMSITYSVFGANDKLAYNVSVTLNLLGTDYLPKQLYGTAAADIFTGTALRDIWNGGNGNDTASSGGDNDILNGGAGNDNLAGGAGNDTLVGGNDNDILKGEAGDDSLNGGAGNDYLDGGTGNNNLAGGLGNDTFIFTVSSKNTGQGNEGNDIFNIRAGNNVAHGNTGKDVFNISGGTNFVLGQEDTDTFNFSGKFGKVTVGGGAGVDTYNVAKHASGYIDFLDSFKGEKGITVAGKLYSQAWLNAHDDAKNIVTIDTGDGIVKFHSDYFV